MGKKLAIILVVIFSPIFVWGQTPDLTSESLFTLIFSSNVYGEIEPCG
jgi:hypothetical protein